jgi:hypothetical protein
MSDFNITLFEACELLNRSKKSISRYIRRGLLHPERVKSQQGTLEYRFNKADIEAFKAQEALNAEQTRQDGTDETGQTGHKEPIKRAEFLENKDFKGQTDETRQDTPEKTRQDRTRETGQDSEVITLLKETTGLLKDQLTKKDEQIKDLGGKIDQLIERDRETNILLGQLQSKVLMLEKPREPINGEPADSFVQDLARKPDETGQERQDTTGQTGQDEPKPEKEGFFKRLFKGEL